MVNQGASQAGGAWIDSGFSIPTDLQWTTTVANKWQIRAESIRKQEQAVHEAKIKELKQYKVYAVVYYDQAGQPKIMWQLEKDGKGVTNPELYRYLEESGMQLTPDLFEFIDYSSWEEKVQNGWKNGYNYITGETYNPLLGGLVATSQYIQDGVTWLNESELGVAIQTLGFTYASYRMMTKNGLVTVESEKASGAKPPKTDFGAENPVSGKDWNNYFRDKYGAGNVQWKNPVSSISELMDTPSSLINANPADVADFVKREGWTVTPLKKGGSAGIPYEEGGGFSMNPPKGTSGDSRYIQYHPGNGHHGEVPYYKISQPNKPTVRIYMDGRYEID